MNKFKNKGYKRIFLVGCSVLLLSAQITVLAEENKKEVLNHEESITINGVTYNEEELRDLLLDATQNNNQRFALAAGVYFIPGVGHFF